MLLGRFLIAGSPHWLETSRLDLIQIHCWLSCIFPPKISLPSVLVELQYILNIGPGHIEDFLVQKKQQKPASHASSITELFANLPINKSNCSASTLMHHNSSLHGRYWGLPLSLLAAGSSCVLEALWPLDDDVRPVLWSRLYQALLEDGADLAETLRHTQVCYYYIYLIC